MIPVHGLSEDQLKYVGKHVDAVETLAKQIINAEEKLNKADWFYLAPVEEPIGNEEWKRLEKKCRPCPFCGGKSWFAMGGTHEIEQYRTFMWTGKEWWEINDRSLWRVVCGCGGMGPHMGSPELAVDAWNRSLGGGR